MELRWYNIENLAVKKFSEVPSVCGVYFVRWLKNGRPVPISRLGGLDHREILYIGSATNLRRRVQELWRGIKGQVEAHTLGKTIAFCKLSEIIDLSEYEISWEELRTRKDALGQESAAIRLYSSKYKEPPPLNLGLRREYFAIYGIAGFGKSHYAYKPDKFIRSVVDC